MGRRLISYASFTYIEKGPEEIRGFFLLQLEFLSNCTLDQESPEEAASINLILELRSPSLIAAG